ncbi:MAG: cation diffusion facilitator family transporter [Casimicrobiaceae bacterium]
MKVPEITNEHEHDDDRGSDQHGHRDGPADYGRAFAIGVTLNLALVVAQVVYGVLANSVALLADAAHNLSDVLGLLLAWGATILAKRLPNKRFTYGLRSSSILAALGNGAFLLLATGGIAWEAIQRFAHPEPVSGATVIGVAALGIAVNGATALLFMSGRKGDLNIRGAFLHMAADAVVSLGVVLAGIGIVYTGWLWLDPVTSLAISVVIVAGTWGLLRDSVRLALHAVPEGIETERVRAYLAGVPGVAEVHDLHIWGMSTTDNALTAHLVIPTGYPGDAVIMEITKQLDARFNIGHATIQVETDSSRACALAPDHVV